MTPRYDQPMSPPSSSFHPRALLGAFAFRPKPHGGAHVDVLGVDGDAARVGPGLHGPEQPDHLVEAEPGGADEGHLLADDQHAHEERDGDDCDRRLGFVGDAGGADRGRASSEEGRGVER